MNKAEQDKICQLARKVKTLQEAENKTESMIRSWGRTKNKATFVNDGNVTLFLSDRRHTGWSCSVDLPASAVTDHLIPVLKIIRDEARKQLKELEIPDATGMQNVCSIAKYEKITERPC